MPERDSFDIDVMTGDGGLDEEMVSPVISRQFVHHGRHGFFVVRASTTCRDAWSRKLAIPSQVKSGGRKWPVVAVRSN